MHKSKRRPEMWFLSYTENNFAPQAEPNPSLDFHLIIVMPYSFPSFSHHSSQAEFTPCSSRVKFSWPSPPWLFDPSHVSHWSGLIFAGLLHPFSRLFLLPSYRLCKVMKAKDKPAWILKWHVSCEGLKIHYCWQLEPLDCILSLW